MKFLNAIRADRLISQIREEGDPTSPSAKKAFEGLRNLGDGAIPKVLEALASAEIVLTGWPPLKDLRGRAPRLRWVHELPAGASNFLDTDIWDSNILVTTSRGLTNRRPMAEYVLAAFLHFARALHLSYRDRERHRFDHQTYASIIIRDKTVCIVGAGIAGLSTAYHLARNGDRVVVVDDGAIGGGETGRTTAHLTSALDDRYCQLESLHGERGARLAALSHTAAIQSIERIVLETGARCEFERVEPRKTVNAREQVPVCREEAVLVGGTIAYRDNNMAPRSSRRIGQKSPPQKVFVYAP